jgi:hypothetical protein
MRRRRSARVVTDGLRHAIGGGGRPRSKVQSAS